MWLIIFLEYLFVGLSHGYISPTLRIFSQNEKQMACSGKSPLVFKDVSQYGSV